MSLFDLYSSLSPELPEGPATLAKTGDLGFPSRFEVHFGVQPLFQVVPAVPISLVCLGKYIQTLTYTISLSYRT